MTRRMRWFTETEYGASRFMGFRQKVDLGSPLNDISITILPYGPCTCGDFSMSTVPPLSIAYAVPLNL
jgi:hypothetical protein